MPALEWLRGLRVVADPAALDAARWSGNRDSLGRDLGGVEVLRFAPDEAFAIGARHVELADDHAVIVDEQGFVGWRPSLSEAGVMDRHTEWSMGGEGLHQGSIAGVPAKLVEFGAGRRLVLTHAAYAEELADRLGWDR